MSSLFPSIGRTAVSLAAVAVLSTPAWAQNTTAGIAGRVTDAAGNPVAGATVAIVHRESGSTVSAGTDAAGRYAARGLRVGGPYRVQVTQGGRTEVRDDVFLGLAETTTLDLELGASTQTITVIGRASTRVNRAAMGAGTSVGSQELAAQASIQRSLQDYARLDPRLSQTEKDRGEIAAAGQNSRYNSITIDSVRINDTFGIEPNNLPTIKQPISIDAIQAVQVNISNYDVTQQGYTGANINAVTKSGTNDFKGSVYHVFRNDDLSGKRFLRRPDRFVTPAPFEDSTTGFTLGGPIVKDKLFFFVSYEELKSSRNAPTFGPIGAGLSDVGITDAQIAAAQAAARGKGFEIGEFSITNTDLSVKDTLLKLDWNISNRHRANLRYSKTEEANPIFPGYSANSLSLSSRNFVTAKTIESTVGQFFSDWTDTFSTEFKLSSRDYTSEPILNSRLPEIALVFTSPAPSGTATGNRTLRFGTEETRHFNRIETNTVNAYLAGNWSLGAHELKVGADIEKNEIFNAFVRQAWGLYTFEGADPVALFAANNPTAYTVQLPRAGFTLLDAAGIVTFENQGLFVQDTWTVNKKLSVTAGLRVDTLGANNAPVHNPAAQAAFGLDNRNTLDGNRLVQPRLGFNYRLDPVDGRASQLRGGIGLFQGSAASVWLINPYQNTGMVLNSVTCSLTTALRCPAGLFTADINNPAVIPGQPPAANVDFLAPGASQPAVWKMNLAWDAELPMGFTVGAEWLHTRVKQGLTYRHLNLGSPTATAPDGRQLFWNAGGRNPACWDGNANPLTTGACATNANNPQQRPTSRFLQNRNFNNVLVAEQTGEGRGNAITLSLQQNLRSLGINWSAAFTHTTATEVSPLTSSTSNSQWANRSNYNPNEAVVANSGSLIRNRVNASVSWSRAFVGNYRTTFGVFYEGRSGRPYSWTFNNDMNGDGVQGNDLLYVPSSVGSGEVLFRLPGQSVAASSAAAEAKFWQIVDANPALVKAKGGVVARNSDFGGFTNNIDVRVSQEVPGFTPRHKGVVTLDILNFGNLLNKKWGRINEMTFNDGNGGFSRRWINYAGIENGKPVYSVNDPFEFVTKNNRGESAWAAQVTLRYEF
ncbi:MAG TPA: TonB-dependent receptor [Burkholderiaceae bacterium]|nr:TonB-dependent receptor [Burkholderiaceae bacterium]